MNLEIDEEYGLHAPWRQFVRWHFNDKRTKRFLYFDTELTFIYEQGCHPNPMTPEEAAYILAWFLAHGAR